MVNYFLSRPLAKYDKQINLLYSFIIFSNFTSNNTRDFTSRNHKLLKSKLKKIRVKPGIMQCDR